MYFLYNYQIYNRVLVINWGLEKIKNFSAKPFTPRHSNAFQYYATNTAQKMKFSIKDFSSKYDQIRIWSHLLKKLLKENFVFCVVKCYRIPKRLEIKGHQCSKMSCWLRMLWQIVMEYVSICLLFFMYRNFVSRIWKNKHNSNCIFFELKQVVKIISLDLF